MTEPGLHEQYKLHEMAVAYAGVLHERVRRLAAEMACELQRRARGACEDTARWERNFRLYLGDLLYAVMTEQCGDSSSPFKPTVRGAFAEIMERTASGAAGWGQAFAEFLAAAGADDEQALAPTAERILAENTGRIMPLADLDAAEAVCEELLAEIFRWDGRAFVITGRRAAEARAVVDRCLSAAGRPGGPPVDAATAENAFKLALTVLFFWRDPSPDVLAGLKEGYAALGGARGSVASPARARGRGERGQGRPQNGSAPGRREMMVEIESFCRVLDVLREAAAKAAG